MADFMPITACNGPRLKDHEKVEEIIRTYYLDPELSVGVSFDHDTGEPSLFLYGFTWPEAWKVPEGTKHEDFDPYTEEQYEDGADGFIGLLKEIAPYLKEPLTVHAVGSTKCFFPLSACEWHIKPQGKKVQITEFRHSSTPELACS